MKKTAKPEETKSYTIWIPPSLHKKLKARAARDGASLSDTHAKAIRLFLRSK